MKLRLLLLGLLLAGHIVPAQHLVEIPSHASLIPGGRILPHLNPPPAPLATQPLRVYSFEELSALGQDVADAGQEKAAGEWLWAPCCSWCYQACRWDEESCHANACEEAWQWRYFERADTQAKAEAFTCLALDDSFYPLQPQYVPAVIRTVAEWDALFPKDSLHLLPDFRYSVVLCVEIFADCHATLQPGVMRLPAEKRLRWYVDERYGGCRGMRTTTLALVVPRPPDDWQIEFVER